MTCSSGLCASPPDLVASSVSCNNTTLAPGQSVSCPITVQNIGGSDAPAFRNELRLSADTNITAADELLATCGGFSLAAGGTQTWVCNGIIPSGTNAGIWHLGAIVDNANDVIESDETNNTNSQQVTVVCQDTASVVSANQVSVWGGDPNTRSTGWVRTGLEASEQWHAYMIFDLAGALPAGATITECTLQITNSGWVAGAARDVQIRRVTDPWSSASITYANQPGSALERSFTVSSLGQYLVDVTSLCQQWMNSNFGMALSSDGTTDPWVDFDSPMPSVFVEYCP